jgi:DNA-binding CsgD family transcriptional regulator
MSPTYFSDEAKRLCDALTPSQRDVLLLLAKGLTRNEAARRLGIARSTLDGHQKAIHRVLDVETTIEAAVIAAKAGLV